MPSLTQRSAGVRRRPSMRGRRVNVNEIERAASILGGGALALFGLRRRGVAGFALAAVGGFLLERGLTGRCLAYDALGISTADDEGPWLERRHGPLAVLEASEAVRVEHAVVVNRTPEQLYAFWRKLENLPRVMSHLESVSVINETRSHWKAKGLAGRTVEWDAEIHNEVPNELIAWVSVPEASVPNAGSVNFRPLGTGRGTEVRVIVEYDPPGGQLGAMAAKLFGEDPNAQIRDDLRRFKQAMEAGELSATEEQRAGA